MRNQLKIEKAHLGGWSGLTYWADGDLDGSNANFRAYSDGRLCLTFGPLRMYLSAAAATELANHMTQAVKSLGGDV